MNVLAALLLVASLAPGLAVGQEFPTRVVRIVVPYTAGGPTDILARAIAPPLAAALGQQVVVDNRAGAGGIIGTELVAKSAPDGHTLVWGTGGTHAINPAIYAKLPYDPIRDFAGITLVAQGTNVLVVHPSVPARSVQQLIAIAKASPGKLTFSSAGNGANSHLAGEMLKTMGGVNMVHVPFKGATPAIVALLSGQADLAILDMPGILPHIRAGRLRPLAVTRPARSAVLPEMPTMIESGFKDFVATSWHALYVPAGTPKAVVAKLNAEIVALLRVPEMQARMANQGADPVGGSPGELDAFLKSEIARWAKVAKAAGARVD